MGQLLQPLSIPHADAVARPLAKDHGGKLVGVVLGRIVLGIELHGLLEPCRRHADVLSKDLDIFFLFYFDSVVKVKNITGY